MSERYVGLVTAVVVQRLKQSPVKASDSLRLTLLTITVDLRSVSDPSQTLVLSPSLFTAEQRRRVVSRRYTSTVAL